jgi:hypothetical protein
MSKLGNTPADDKKYDELKKIKLSLYTKSLPYFQKSYDLLNAKSSLSDDEKATFQGTLVALQTIFESLGQSEKGTEMANKLKTL